MNREEFLARRKRTKVEVPGFGDFYFKKTFSLEQQIEIQQLVKDLSGAEAGHLMIAMRLCDERGEPIEGLSYLDIPKMDAEVYLAVVTKMNEERAGSVEEAAKN